jgi:hypothetical protein
VEKAKISLVSSKKLGTRIQRLFLVPVRWSLALSLFSVNASASAETLNKVVSVNHPLMLAHYASVFDDCSSRGRVEVRVIQGPAHGSITMREMANFSYFPYSNLTQCNSRKVKGTTVTYQPQTMYVGTDWVSLDIIFPSGTERDQTFNITVK